MKQMGGDRPLPEETNYQTFSSKTNILQTNHIVPTLLHCSECVYCVNNNDLDQLTCGTQDWILSHGINKELLEPPLFSYSPHSVCAILSAVVKC